MLARVYRDPWESIREVRGEMDRIFNRDANAYAETASDWVPLVDIKEGKDAYEVITDVPGVNPKDIDVSLEEGVLTIRGDRKSEDKDEGDGYTRTERVYGSFYRRFTLPETADAEHISAKTVHGVLKLHIPKKEKALPKRISVEG